jgi:hypothetical protein
MEPLLLAGVLAAGYIAKKRHDNQANAKREGFVSAAAARPGSGNVPIPMDGLRHGEAPAEIDLAYSAPPSYHAAGATPQRPDATRAQVRMNPPGEEADPVYVGDGSGTDTILSPLGVPMKASDWRHGNMMPFYRGREVRQNLGVESNTGILDSLQGAGTFNFGKREQEPMFDMARGRISNPYGMEPISDFMQDRILDPTSHNGVLPFDQIRQQKNLDEAVLRDHVMPRTTDELRTANNPKLSYGGVVIAGEAPVKNRPALGEVRQYKPDTYYINEGERNGIATADVTKAAIRPVQVVKYTPRGDSGREIIGPAGQVDTTASYNTGSYRAPHAQQHDGFGFRNLVSPPSPEEAANDNDLCGWMLEPNERTATGQRTVGLNLAPGAEAMMARPGDFARPTRKEEIEGNIRAAGNLSMPIPPKMTVIDPADVARTTVKETLIDNTHTGWYGLTAPPKLPAYDPDDIVKRTLRNTTAEPDRVMNMRPDGPNKPLLSFPDGMRPAQKAGITANSRYVGNASSESRAHMVYDDKMSMRTNCLKEQVAQGRRPMGSNTPLFTGAAGTHQTVRRLAQDDINEWVPVADRLATPPPDPSQLGAIRPAHGLSANVYNERNDPRIYEAMRQNPYVQQTGPGGY